MMDSPLVATLFLIGFGLICGLSSAFATLGKAKAESIAKGQRGFAKYIFSKERRHELAHAITLSKNILLIFYVLSALHITLTSFDQKDLLNFQEREFTLSILLIIALAICADVIARMISLWKPRAAFTGLVQITTLFILPFWPISALFFQILKTILPPKKDMGASRFKDKILEMLSDSEIAPALEDDDQKLLLSMVNFKERIAREVMVPRIDITTLSADNTVEEALEIFLQEGYSRIPVWKENVDHIIGVLYHKDLLNLLFQNKGQEELKKSIEPLLKPLVYTPETKKISGLLQEFRTKQIHLAIVVDEYGGTEGIVTIEDILEELVGEIADEYDLDEEALFHPLPSGGWLIDAKMTILDINEQLDVSIPQNPEYDTIGGFVFHKAKTIPQKGWLLHQDLFDLEVISSTERAVEKVRITPH